MCNRTSIKRACAVVLVALVAACSDPVGPTTKAVGPNTKATVRVIGPNTVTANGVGTSPRPQP